MSISENGKVSATYDYHVDGQVAKRVGSDGNAQSYFWDGLALIKRGDMSLTNEPYITGGNPVIAGDKTLFNDILGTTQGSTTGKEFSQINRDAFVQTLDNSTDTDYDYFTGKPKVEGLGYAFLFRNYNAGLGKWTTSDPLGYPDGWNNFAYCNNGVINYIDRFGTDIYHVVDSDGSACGHSAAIVGNSQDGYKIMNHGGAVGPDETKTYSTPAAALAELNSNRPGSKEYDKVQKWETTREQDNAAKEAMNNYTAKNYNEYTNNCVDSVKGILDAAGQDRGTGITPNSFYTSNANRAGGRLPGPATYLNYNDFKNGTIE